MKENRALAWKVLSRLANVKIASAFHSWWLEVKEKKRHGRIMSKIAAKMKNKTVLEDLSASLQKNKLS